MGSRRVGIAAELINGNAGPPTYRSVACTHRGADRARFHRAGQRGRSGSDVGGFESADGLRRAEAAAAEEDQDQWRRIASSKCVWHWSRARSRQSSWLATICCRWRSLVEPFAAPRTLRMGLKPIWSASSPKLISAGIHERAATRRYLP